MNKRILFVCTINKSRSITDEKIYSEDARFEVKSAGTDKGAVMVINQELVDWADSIVVMEKHHQNSIRKLFPEIYKRKKIVCLFIPDEYDYMQPELVNLLKYKFEDVYRRGLL